MQAKAIEVQSACNVVMSLKCLATKHQARLGMFLLPLQI